MAGVKSEHANILLDDEVIDDIRRTFQPHDPEVLCRDETIEIAANLCRFFGVLERWRRDDDAPALPVLGELPTQKKKGDR